MKRISLVLLLLLLCVFNAWCITYAIEDYTVQVVVGKDAVHYVNEDITMNFATTGHGFYRDIPVSFDGSPVSAKIRNLYCSDPYSVEYENGFCTLKIGDADKTVKGSKHYVIHYNYDLGIDINEGYDEFYFDLLGDAWECSTSVFRFQVFLPKEGLSLNDVNVWVTKGSYGSDSLVECNVQEIDQYYVFFGEVDNLRRGQAVTMRMELPEGWYVGAREPWDATPTFEVVAPYLSIVMVLIAYILWAKNGRDKKPIITARFEAPEGYSPMIVGFLADDVVDDKDIIAMIFNWADRGLLTINEEKKDKFSFTKLADIEDDVPRSERDLFNSFFRRCKVGETLRLTDIQNNNFAEAMIRAKITVTKYFTKDRALHSSKAKGLGVLVGFGVIVPLLLFSASQFMSEYSIELFFGMCFFSLFITVVNIVCQWACFRKWYLRKSNVASCILCALPMVFNAVVFFGISDNIVLSLICAISSYTLAIFAIIMDKRSDYGQKLFEEVLGYREFIDKVSMDELRLMIDKDPQIYYKVLSYAVVLGLEETWSKKFSSIALQAPSWYIGSNVVDAMYYSHLVGRMRTVIAFNSVPQSSGRSVGGGGFHSTGFAGGGFGGGGGRAW